MEEEKTINVEISFQRQEPTAEQKAAMEKWQKRNTGIACAFLLLVVVSCVLLFANMPLTSFLTLVIAVVLFIILLHRSFNPPYQEYDLRDLIDDITDNRRHYGAC